MTRRIFTLGHSNHSIEHLLLLLRQHHIEVVVDVRSQPVSRLHPQFNEDPLRQELTRWGIKYLFMGLELGGRPARDDLYDAEGHVRYDRVAQTPAFRGAIARLQRGVAAYRVALLCAEEDPEACHRRLLIGRVLSDSPDQPMEVVHIRGDGALQIEDGRYAVPAPAAPPAVQISLFGGAPSVATSSAITASAGSTATTSALWRSVRPVHPQRRAA